jgi:hypothetical protein
VAVFLLCMLRDTSAMGGCATIIGMGQQQHPVVGAMGSPY